MTYAAPVRRRRLALVVVGAVAIASFVGLGTIFSNASYGKAFVSALLITAAAVATGVFVVLVLLMPTHVEVDGNEIRLVAPRTTTRYVPAEMAIRLRPDGDFALVRMRTGRTLAVFSPSDPAAAESAFTAAGAQIA